MIVEATILMLMLVSVNGIIVVNEGPEQIQKNFISQLVSMGQPHLLSRFAPVSSIAKHVVFNGECQIPSDIRIDENTIIYGKEDNFRKYCDNDFVTFLQVFQNHPNVSALILACEYLFPTEECGPRTLGEIKQVTMFVTHISKIEYDFFQKYDQLNLTVFPDPGPFYDFVNSGKYIRNQIGFSVTFLILSITCVLLISFHFYKSGHSAVTIGVQSLFFIALSLMTMSIRVGFGETSTIYRYAYPLFRRAAMSSLLWASISFATTAYYLTVLLWYKITSNSQSKSNKTAQKAVSLFFFFLPLLQAVLSFIRLYTAKSDLLVLQAAILVLTGGSVCMGTWVYGFKTLCLIYKRGKKWESLRKHLKISLFIMTESLLLFLLVLISVLFSSFGVFHSPNDPMSHFNVRVLRDVVGLLLALLIIVSFLSSFSRNRANQKNNRMESPESTPNSIQLQDTVTE